MTDAKRFFIYARKSTDVEDKQVRSIDAQLFELQELARRKERNVADVLIERVSAKSPGKRPVFNEMIRRIDSGEANGIMAWHPDRLARNMTDGGRIIDLIDTGKLHSLEFPSFWFEPTPQGKFMLGMAFSQSKYYVDALAENTSRGLREKVRRGEYPGLAPLGYLNDRRIKRIVVDRERAPIVIEAFDVFATGTATIETLRHIIAKRGVVSKSGKPLPNTTVTYLLKNPLYYGHFRFCGDIYEGNHEPLITKALFDRVQAVLAGRFRHTAAKVDTTHKPYMGLLHCGECGCTITAEIQKGHTYYRCTKKKLGAKCSQPYTRENLLDQQIATLLKPHVLAPEWADEMLRMLRNERSNFATHAKEAAAAKRRQIDALKSKMDVLLDMRLDNQIDSHNYTQRKTKLMGDMKTMQDEMASAVYVQNTWLEPFEKWILAAKTAGEIAVHGSPASRRGLAEQVFGSNLVLVGRKARGEATKPWSYLTQRELGDTLVHLYEAARTHFRRSAGLDDVVGQ